MSDLEKSLVEEEVFDKEDKIEDEDDGLGKEMEIEARADEPAEEEEETEEPAVDDEDDKDDDKEEEEETQI